MEEDTKRTATIICLEDTHFITLNRKDFINKIKVISFGLKWDNSDLK
jgi:hypothetical protein